MPSWRRSSTTSSQTAAALAATVGASPRDFERRASPPRRPRWRARGPIEGPAWKPAEEGEDIFARRPSPRVRRSIPHNDFEDFRLDWADPVPHPSSSSTSPPREAPTDAGKAAATAAAWTLPELPATLSVRARAKAKAKAELSLHLPPDKAGGGGGSGEVLSARHKKSSASVTVSLPRESVASQDTSLALRHKRSTDSRAMATKQHELELQKCMAQVCQVSSELDSLLVEMGRKLLVWKPGQPCAVKLVPTACRVVEVKLPNVSDEDSVEWSITIDARCDHKFHAKDRAALRDGMPQEEPFQVVVADSENAAQNGPFRLLSEDKFSHKLSLVSDAGSIFLGFVSNFHCNIIFLCRIQSRQASAMAQTSTKLTDLAVTPRVAQGTSRGAPRRLHDKLEQHRNNLVETPPFDEDPSQNEAAMMSMPSKAARMASMTSILTSATANDMGPSKSRFEDPPNSAPHEVERTGPRSFREFILGEGWKMGGPNDENLRSEALRRAMRLWLGPTSRFCEGLRKPKGAWIKKLSANFPKKLTLHLRKTVQDQHALTTVAVAGASVFFLTRWRELHLVRARKALRQLVWYKVLFAASRLRCVAAELGEGRKQLREEERRMLHCSGRGSVAKGLSRARGWRLQAMGEPHLCIAVARGIETLRTGGASGAGGGGNSRSPPRDRHSVWSEQSLGKSAGMPGTWSSTFGGMMGLDLDTSDSEEPELFTRQKRARGALVTTDISMELKRAALASQGFIVRPDDIDYSRRGIATPIDDEVPHDRCSEAAKALSKKFGFPVRVEGSDGDPGAGVAGETLLQVTIRPQELPRVMEVLGSKVQPMSMARFRQHQKDAQHRMAQLQLERRAREEAILHSRQNRGSYPKRYLLRFFDYPQDLPWLDTLQSMMMVIHGVSWAFQSPHDLRRFEEKLKRINEARRKAGKLPGLFPPCEAALWSHSVVLGLAARLQKATVRGGSTTAWKAILFEGSYIHSSERDAWGCSLYSARSPGGHAEELRRRVVDVAGPFLVQPSSILTSDSQRDTDEAMVSIEDCLATRLGSGYRFRSFGRPPAVTSEVVRSADKTLECPPPTKPRVVVMEEHYQESLARGSMRSSSHSRILEDTRERTEAKFKKRAHDSGAPMKEQKWKDNIFPMFDGVISKATSTTASASLELTSISNMGSLSLVEGGQTSIYEYSDYHMDSLLVEPSIPFEAAEPSPPSSLPRPLPAAPCEAASPRATHTHKVPPAHPTTTTTTTTAAKATAGTAPNSNNQHQEAAANPLGGGLVAKPPLTVQDIGRLVAECDVLGTILATDSVEGGIGVRCAAGWDSGYRTEPMTKEELRRLRLLEKRTGANRGNRQKGAQPQTAR